MKIDDSLRIKMKQLILKENHNVISTYFYFKRRHRGFI